MHFGLISALVAIAAIVAIALRSRNKNLRLQAACRGTFDTTYATLRTKPALHMSYSYGVPIFKVTHPSREAHNQSENQGLNSGFVASIQSLCVNCGSKQRPYDAAHAIQFAWLEVTNEVFYPSNKKSPRDGEA
jgi:hypothetical protein